MSLSSNLSRFLFIFFERGDNVGCDCENVSKIQSNNLVYFRSDKKYMYKGVMYNKDFKIRGTITNESFSENNEKYNYLY